jgi:prepilin-type N-terminal cleavage/methylation domain-containing protein
MKKRILGIRGFTLIELITGVVIVGIISVMAGMGLVQIANAYLLTKKSTVGAQQSQITLTRLSKELAAMETISSASATSLTYTRAGVSHTLSWTGVDQPLTLDGDTMIDKIQAFSMTYHDTYLSAASSYSAATSMIELTFQLRGYGDTPVVFVKRSAI